MDTATRQHIRRERDRLVRRELPRLKGLDISERRKTRPSHWPPLIVIERNGTTRTENA